MVRRAWEARNSRAARGVRGFVRAVAGPAVFVGAFVTLCLFGGLPTAISIGGGLVVLIFGSLWPLLWVASLLPPDRVPFIRRQCAPAEMAAQRPHIVVIAPARNEEPVAERLVSQFLAQEYDDWTLMVVANNCTDRTADVARAAAQGDPRIQVIEATFENGVKADALNMALEMVEGDVVLELDSDNQVPPDLLLKIALAFSDPNVAAVQTQIRAYNARDSLLAAFQDLEFLIYSEVWNRGRAAVGLGSSIGGTGFAARTEILRRLGGWTRDLVEDFEMHTRLVRAGVHVRYLPWACVYDEKPITWSAIVKQRKRWIRGHLEVAVRLTRRREQLGIVDRFYLYSPVIIALMISLFGMGQLSMAFPKAITGYAYFSPWFWCASIVVMITALATTAIRARDWWLVPLVLPYLCFFTYHWVVVTFAAIMPVSWAHSKTEHGVEADHGVLPWLGIDSPGSARLVTTVFTIAALWQFPLWGGLSTAPSPLGAPVLRAQRSYVAWVIDSALAAGYVQGIVRDATGKPLPGAQVWLVASDGTQYRTHAATNGSFSFANVPDGAYTVTISKGGYPDAVSTVTMPATGGIGITGEMGTGTGSIVVVVPY